MKLTAKQTVVIIKAAVQILVIPTLSLVIRILDEGSDLTANEREIQDFLKGLRDDHHGPGPL